VRSHVVVQHLADHVEELVKLAGCKDRTGFHRDIIVNNCHCPNFSAFILNMLPQYTNNGTYGCVMRPSVSCKTKKSTDPNTVSKLFTSSTNSSEEVFLHNKIIDKIDPNGVFTINLLETCDIETKKFPSQEISKCRNFQTKHTKMKKLPQIVYEYGGYDIKESCRRYAFEEMFRALRTPFQGIIILKEKGYVHVDIKPENLVFNIGTGKMSLIDFGLAKSASKLYIKDNDYIFKHSYPYYPPEFLLAANKFAKKYMYSLENNLSYIRGYVDELRGILPSTSDFDTYLRKLAYPNFDSMKDDCLDPYKVDVYMLGVTILDTLYMCKRHNTVNIVANPKFFKEVLKLVYNMTLPNPKDRASPEEAYMMYKSVVAMINVIPKSPTRISPLKIKKTHTSPKPTAKKCPDGKILTPLTNRCIKMKIEKKQEEKPCPPGKVRHPVTKRCRKVVIPVKAGEKPCPPGKVRNPVTKRCRKIA